MNKILITGFVPFGDYTSNASYNVVQSLDVIIEDGEIYKAYLPVVYDKQVFIDCIEQYQPNVVLLCGQADGRSKVTLEQIAINYQYASLADNLGQLKLGELIEKEGDAAYFSSIPVKEIVEKMQKKNKSIGLSLSAGGYVCNFCFYTLLHHTKGSHRLVGFVHFPLYDGQNDNDKHPSLPLSEMTTILKDIILEINQLMS